ncbi:Disease resistance-like protein DSC1 [Linum grandiflorum]
MAASSYSTPYTGEWEYDVFLCFRGDDTRDGFTGHLLSALSDKKIRTFIDNMLAKTESIDELISILQRCALSVVVFSEKFADSIWCLEEVVTIARRMTEFGHRVLPVFYKVDPYDVTGNSRSYATTMDREYKSRSTYVEDKKKWMDALKAVANSSGHTSQNIKIESELIKAIVDDVQKQLIDMSPSIKSAHLVGMGSRILEVERLLAMDTLDDTRIIGLWGMGGVGKTTLAKACYERITSSNKGINHHFIGSIGEKCGKGHGVEEVVNELYSELLSENNINRQDLDIIYRRGRLSRSRVFIVLDNVETPLQLEQILLGEVAMNLENLFAPGSKIIVTTRDKRVLDYAKAMIYNVADLDDSESIQLFSLRALRKHHPPPDWEGISCLATSYCKGNPLTLRVLGGILFNQDKYYWQSFLSELKLIQSPEIHDIVERSCNKLGAEEKRIFLDVACFLHGISITQLIVYMSTVYPSAYAKVKNLIDGTLLVCEGEKIEVHDLLKEMAWHIVNKEPKLGKRSRLVDPDDIHKLLTTRDVKSWTSLFFNLFKVGEMVLPRRKKAKVVDIHWKGYNPLEEYRETQGISLNLEQAKEMYLEANAFEGMNFLTFLRFKSSNILSGNHSKKEKIKMKIHLPSGGLNSLPDGLKWLQWDRYPSKSLPSKFYSQHIVHLIIRESPIERCWKGYDQPQLVNLMVLNLSYCENLIVIPNISSSSNLEELLLSGCESLVEVPCHVQYLTKLITLDLNYCRNLKRLPPKLDSKLLNHVRMCGCRKVAHCPEIISRELVEFDLNDTSLDELPNAIYNVKQDGTLRLSGENITKFPVITTSLQRLWLSHTSIREIDLHDYHQTSSKIVLPRFELLYFVDNQQLKSLSKSIWNMVSHELVINGSPLIETLPEISEPVTVLASLQIRECGSLKSLPSSISNITSLKSLELLETGIKSLPSSIQELRELYHINLRFCKSLETMPSSIYKLSNLLKLTVSRCESIRSLPELPPNLVKLDVNGCKSLQALPSNTSKLKHLKILHFEECPQLDQAIPVDIVANFLVRASLSLSPQHREVVCSRSELPDWFTYRSMNLKDEENCSVKVELSLPHDGDQPMVMKGIAFGLVFSSDSLVYLRCDCKFGNTIVAYWPSKSLGFFSGDDSSEILSLVVNMHSSGVRAVGSEEEEEAWYVKYAGLAVSFHFYLYSSDGKTMKKKVKIKRCGVSLLY